MNNSPTPFIRFDRREVSGGLGDLGTFIPLLVAMVTTCGLQLGPALFFSGLMNVITGVTFGIPMPVQPMKAIAAVAISEGFNESQILIAGIGTSAVILLLSLTGLIDKFNRWIPRNVVRGLQLALGLKLLTKGLGFVASTPWIGWDSVVLGLACGGLALVFYQSKRFPSALVIFAIGLAALLIGRPSVMGDLRLGISWVWPDFSSVNDWTSGLLRGAVPQIPLTLLNSVIAVCALSSDLFPRRPAAPRRVALSVALMNLICCPLGGMPMCHGAGGLAAQYRFGGRTGGSAVILGVAKILLALLFGASLLSWLQHYPESVLGVLLVFSGLELAMVCRDQTAPANFFVLLLTAGCCIAVNTAVGFLVGWAIASMIGIGVIPIGQAENKEGKSS